MMKVRSEVKVDLAQQVFMPMPARRKGLWFTLFVLLAGVFHVAEAGPSGLPLPRFVSLRSSEINLRRGPGTQYPIDWVFVRANLPVEIISEYETWRKIRDIEGTEGWVHQSMLSGKRTVFTPPFQQAVILKKHPETSAAALAKIEGGVVAFLIKCQDKWCKIKADGYEGWIDRAFIWGVREGEIIK